MVNSVIGGFQKMPKNKRYNPEEDYDFKSKKKKKHNRRSSKFDSQNNNADENSYDDYDEDFEQYN